MSKQHLFGTDGIREIANQEPMTPEIAFRLGRAVGHYFKNSEKTNHPFFVIGKDTRRSGSMLESAVAAGLYSVGADALFAGILPTPAVALLTRELGARGGIVISASHNPAADNGLKIFGGDGYKLHDAQEAEIEKLILTSTIDSIRPTGAEIGIGNPLPDALERYIAAVVASVPSLSLEGIRIAVDAANGAAFESTPQILKKLGATLFLFYASPDGMNINENCGSTHGEELRRITRESKAHLGIAHDGDADRVLLCDEEGNLVDGDEILAITALEALEQGKLAHQTVVATIMSNFGLDECLKNAGGNVLRTPVGDRYVIEAMQQGGFDIGGEQSGHLIFHDHSTTGDGIVAALQVLHVMVKKQQPLSLLRQCLKKYPQAQRNLRMNSKPSLSSLKEAIPLLGEVEKQIDGRGRLLLRYSGTEPLLRLLIEGRDEVFINHAADKIVEELQRVMNKRTR
ncbi:MAG: phosphoglucosamine mutase [Chthoniobacterales bacterium]